MQSRFLAITVLCAATALAAENYTLGPDSQPQPGVLKGTVTKQILAPGKFYPGTPHNYAVYVPAQYDAARPAPFMIFFDGSGALGNGQRVPIVFDNLIAKHELPPMIGIFVDPGVLPAKYKEAQSRFERVFEYDSLSDRYSRFLLEELIPEVAKKYNLSKNPDDHALSGVSTGAVGAFAAAWNRPDQFHRVLSFIGTYVAMKGADALPALIRRTEPKPIRIYLQDGKADHVVDGHPFGTFYAGSWPINNQVMYEAFEFAGYEAKLVLGDEGHNMKQGAAIMPDALRWLWAGYPAPVVAHEPAAMKLPGWDARAKVYSIVSSDKPWEQVGGAYHSAASPTSDSEGNVYFADPADNRIYKVSGKTISVFKEDTGGASSLRVGPGNRLYVNQSARKRIVSYSPQGVERAIAEHIEAIDIAVNSRGAVYFTTSKGIGRIDEKGKSVITFDVDELAQPSGLTLSPDQAMLVVTDAQSRFSWSFQIESDGSLVNGEPFYRLEMPEAGWLSNVKAVAEDSIGQVYFATPLGIQGAEANGRIGMILNPPEQGAVTSLAFAGKDLNWLYVTENNKLFRRPVKVTGAAAWAPIKLPKPPL
jgi:gluconolactonase